jgi:hypothetical protein
MALPTGPIPLVAFDEIIEESWGDAVAQSLNNLNQSFDRLLWKPTAEMLATTSSTTWTQWFRIGGPTGEITVPDWANKVIVGVGINGIRATGTGDTTYLLAIQVGPEQGRSIRQTNTVAPGGWFGVAWADLINCSAIEGDRSVKVLAMRTAGNQWAVDTNSDISLTMQFQGAIG